MILPIIALVLLFVILLRPVFQGEQMREEFIFNCNKRGGILLENKRAFGTQYECASYIGK